MNNNKISSLILSITIVILLINNSMGSEQSHNTAVFQSFDVQYEKSPLFVAYENDRKMPLSAHKHTFLSKISAKHKEQSSFYNLNLADINKILTNNGLPTTTYFRYKLLSNIIQALRWQLFMDAFLHVSRLLFNVLDNATYVPVEQSFFEACYNQTFLIIGTANLPNVNEALLKQYPVAYDKFGFCLQEASKFRNYEVVSTLDDVCHENEKITKASSANSYDEFNKIFDDLRIDDEEQVTTGA
ncbi:MAG: hypothetical protein LBP31_02160, partial [Holosporales bacterium]|nr:hypothetical protein [Holosporales bacterium]